MPVFCRLNLPKFMFLWITLCIQFYVENKSLPIIGLSCRAKIRNIEATEEAKQKLMIERMKKKDEVSHFVPTNMAVNFVQHDR